MPTNPLLTELYNLLREAQTDLHKQPLNSPQLNAIKNQIDILIHLLDTSEQDDIDELNDTFNN